MIKKEFEFNNIIKGINKQKKAYQNIYIKNLKPLFESNPVETMRLLITKLKLYKKILFNLDNKIEDLDKFKGIAEKSLDYEAIIYSRGQYDAYQEMREYLDEKVCKINNMFDCIEENNPEIGKLMKKEAIV